MTVIDAQRFQSEARRINSSLGRFRKSALDPLFKKLGNHHRTHLSPQLRAEVQELIYHVPHDRQIKYAAAFAVLQAGGFHITGRPCDPTMNFVRFDQGPFAYVGVGSDGNDQMAILDPGSLHHVFDFKWKSTAGNMQSLANVWTREHITFRTMPNNPPFNDAMGTTMHFTWGDTQGATNGYGRDDHSIKPPKLVARYPLAAGWLITEQWYQYSHDGVTYQNIPGAAYLIHKGIQLRQGEWCFVFKKTNWAPHNTLTYKFEAEYPIGAPPPVPAKAGQQYGRTNGNRAEISDYGRLVSLQ